MMNHMSLCQNPGKVRLKLESLLKGTVQSKINLIEIREIEKKSDSGCLDDSQKNNY